MGHVILIYAGAGVAAVWGVAHALALRSAIAGFEPLSDENRRLLTMEWIGEALTLVFVGVLAALVASATVGGERLARLVTSACAGMLVVMAVWCRLTGGRTRQQALRFGALVKTAAAALLWTGAWS